MLSLHSQYDLCTDDAVNVGMYKTTFEDYAHGDFVSLYSMTSALTMLSMWACTRHFSRNIPTMSLTRMRTLTGTSRISMRSDTKRRNDLRNSAVHNRHGLVIDTMQNP